MAGAARITENPFHVLGLPPDAPRADVERTGQRLLAELALGRPGALTYATPFGREARTADLVRVALAELRDPTKRLAHELWAALPVVPVVTAGSDGASEGSPKTTLPWKTAERLLGVRRR